MSLRTAAAFLVALTLVVSVPGAAQSPPTDSARRTVDTLSLDSLAARLARAEAAIAILRQQIADEAESAAHTRSRFHLELSAQILMNAFATSGRVNNIDVPLTVLVPPPPASGPPTNSAFGVTLRQTRLGAATSIDNVLGGTFAGDIDVDFFGGVQTASGDRRLFPEPRMRTARARLVWPKTEIMFGSDMPLISGLNPLSLAAIGSPDFSGAGNLWNWLGQARLTQTIASLGSGSHSVTWAIQGAVMTPYAAQVAPNDPDLVDLGERSTRPAFEARLRTRWGSLGSGTVSDALLGSTGGEIGLGVHRGWVATSPGVLQDSRALAIDAHIVLLPRLEIRGEGYTGQLLRGLGGGAIGQNFGALPVNAPPNTFGPAIRDAAGWAQINVQPLESLISGVGCGVDVTNPDDAATRLQNTVCAAHVDWRPTQPLVFGIEYRQLGTRYSTGTFGAHHLNFIFGFEL
ncbi:MAG TPA: hypothetical protein VGJ18_21450 [Gemmatimonadaceae bacterium]